RPRVPLALPPRAFAGGAERRLLRGRAPPSAPPPQRGVDRGRGGVRRALGPAGSLEGAAHHPGPGGALARPAPRGSDTDRAARPQPGRGPPSPDPALVPRDPRHRPGPAGPGARLGGAGAGARPLRRRGSPGLPRDRDPGERALLRAPRVCGDRRRDPAPRPPSLADDPATSPRRRRTPDTLDSGRSDTAGEGE